MPTWNRMDVSWESRSWLRTCLRQPFGAQRGCVRSPNQVKWHVQGTRFVEMPDCWRQDGELSLRSLQLRPLRPPSSTAGAVEGIITFLPRHRRQRCARAVVQDVLHPHLARRGAAPGRGQCRTRGAWRNGSRVWNGAARRRSAFRQYRCAGTRGIPGHGCRRQRGRPNGIPGEFIAAPCARQRGVRAAAGPGVDRPG